MKKLIMGSLAALALIACGALLGMQGAKASSFDGIKNDTVYFKQGDSIILPNHFGTYVMVGGSLPDVYWFDTATRWFTTKPVRNYTTVKVSIPYTANSGDYFFLEYSVKTNGDPLNIRDIAWVQEYRFTIKDCGGYTICY